MYGKNARKYRLWYGKDSYGTLNINVTAMAVQKFFSPKNWFLWQKWKIEHDYRFYIFERT